MLRMRLAAPRGVHANKTSRESSQPAVMKRGLLQAAMDTSGTQPRPVANGVTSTHPRGLNLTARASVRHRTVSSPRRQRQRPHAGHAQKSSFHIQGQTRHRACSTSDQIAATRDLSLDVRRWTLDVSVHPLEATQPLTAQQYSRTSRLGERFLAASPVAVAPQKIS